KYRKPHPTTLPPQEKGPPTPPGRLPTPLRLERRRLHRGFLPRRFKCQKNSRLSDSFLRNTPQRAENPLPPFLHRRHEGLPRNRSRYRSIKGKGENTRQKGSNSPPQGLCEETESEIPK